MTLEESIKSTNVQLCYSCGKCTLACPLTHDEKVYSPRRIVERILAHGEEAIDADEMWECLTCNLCTGYCPSDVHYPVFVREIREKLVDEGCDGECTHSDVLKSIMRLMSGGKMKQKRLEWLDDTVQTDDKSDTLLFVGCAPYYDLYFKDLGSHIESAKSAIRLLNHVGVKPRVLEDEVCCGHDLLWTGEKEAFERLRELNTETIKKSKVKRIIFTCPECYHTLKEDYDLEGVELQHLSVFLSENAEKLKFKKTPRKITFQDSCRLGRYQKIYEPPRELLHSIPGVELVEFEDNRRMAACCGTSCWMNCDQNSKRMQVERLTEAAGIAGAMVTACPKCLIHFRCAMDNETDVDVEVTDLFTFLAESLETGR